MGSSLFLLLLLGCEFLHVSCLYLILLPSHSAFACSEWLTWRWIIMSNLIFGVNFSNQFKFFKLIENFQTCSKEIFKHITRSHLFIFSSCVLFLSSLLPSTQRTKCEWKQRHLSWSVILAGCVMDTMDQCALYWLDVLAIQFNNTNDLKSNIKKLQK